jgi:pentatricopeptide repeat protein
LLSDNNEGRSYITGVPESHKLTSTMPPLKNITFSNHKIISQYENGAVSELDVLKVTTSLINKCETIENVKFLVDQITNAGILLNINFYCVIMSRYSQIGDYQEMLDMFYNVNKQEIAVNTTFYTIAISACKYSRDLPRAFDIFTDMKSRGVPVNTIVYNTLISCYRGSENWQDALSILDEMESNNIPLSTLTYVTIILVCLDGGSIDIALKILNMAIKAKILTPTLGYSVDVNNVICLDLNQRHILSESSELDLRDNLNAGLMKVFLEYHLRENRLQIGTVLIHEGHKAQKMIDNYLMQLGYGCRLDKNHGDRLHIINTPKRNKVDRKGSKDLHK